MLRRHFLAIGAGTAAFAGPAMRVAANHSNFVLLSGRRIHYETYGAGAEALIFIHGWTCDLTFWRGQEAVYNSQRSLLIDLPGHGLSDKPHRPYPLELFAHAVETVMHAARVERAVLIGHSLGGPIAYAFLRLFPKKVSGMVLVDAFVARQMAGPANRAAAAASFAKIARSMRGAGGEKAFAQRVDSCFTAQTPERLRAAIRAKMAATPKHVRVAALTSISSLRPPPEDETFDLPALAIQSSESGTRPRFEQMRSIFPRLELIEWEGAGHFLMMEDPERFNRELQQFLGSLS